MSAQVTHLSDPPPTHGSTQTLACQPYVAAAVSPCRPRPGPCCWRCCWRPWPCALRPQRPGWPCSGSPAAPGRSARACMHMIHVRMHASVRFMCACMRVGPASGWPGSGSPAAPGHSTRACMQCESFVHACKWARREVGMLFACRMGEAHARCTYISTHNTSMASSTHRNGAGQNLKLAQHRVIESAATNYSNRSDDAANATHLSGCSTQSMS